MLTISNIPNEVYESAIRKAGLESWGLDRAAEAWDYQTSKRGFCDGELEEAIYDCMTYRNDFDQDTGEFESFGGWQGGGV